MVGQAGYARSVRLHHEDVDVPGAATRRGEGHAAAIRGPLRVLVVPIAHGTEAPHRARGDVDHEQARRAFAVRLEDDLPRRARRLCRYLRQNAMRCQPKGRTQDRGSVLKVPTKHVL